MSKKSLLAIRALFLISFISVGISSAFLPEKIQGHADSTADGQNLIEKVIEGKNLLFYIKNGKPAYSLDEWETCDNGIPEQADHNTRLIQQFNASNDPEVAYYYLGCGGGEALLVE